MMGLPYLLSVSKLIHGEAALGGSLFEGDALAALPEMLAGCGDGAAVFLCQFL
jgi:hypothetical protein